MKKLLLIVLAVLITIMVFVFVIGSLGKSREKEGVSEIISKLENTDYKNLNVDEKKEVVDFFINGDFQYDNENFLLNKEINNIIKNSVKYPETLLVKNIFGEYTKDFDLNTNIRKEVLNVDYTNGAFDIIRQFKSENKLGMLVNGSIKVSIKNSNKKFIVSNIEIN